MPPKKTHLIAEIYLKISTSILLIDHYLRLKPQHFKTVTWCMILIVPNFFLHWNTFYSKPRFARKYVNGWSLYVSAYDEKKKKDDLPLFYMTSLPTPMVMMGAESTMKVILCLILYLVEYRLKYSIVFVIIIYICIIRINNLPVRIQCKHR